MIKNFSNSTRGLYSKKYGTRTLEICLTSNNKKTFSRPISVTSDICIRHQQVGLPTSERVAVGTRLGSDVGAGKESSLLVPYVFHWVSH